MNCAEARQHWSLYHDSEGDAELHYEVSEHLAVCPPCAQWFSQQSRLEGLLEDELRAPSASPELWEQALCRAGLKRPTMVRRWMWLSGVAACLLVGAMMGWRLFTRNEPPAMDLARLSADWHQRLEDGAEQPQFRSQSDLEVEQFLRQRVTFPVRCPPRQDAGFQVHGAGVGRMADQPAAYLSGLVDESPVSIFVLPDKGLNTLNWQTAPIRPANEYRTQEGPYRAAMAVIDHNAVVVVGQATQDRLDRVLHAYGTYPHHR